MPRKAKEKNDENEIIDKKNIIAEVSSETKGKKTSAKKTTTTKKRVSTKKKDADSANLKVEDNTESSVKTSTKKSTGTKKSPGRPKKIVEENVVDSGSSDSKNKKIEKKSSTTKSTTSSSTRKTSSKKTPSKTTAAKKSTPRKRTSKKITEVDETPIQFTEYYDLPYKYGNTIVKILAQTPKTLFVYWEVSDLDIENFRKNYGDNFFEITKPIIIVHNLTHNKSYEVEINDFANCWYLNTEDSDCKFDIELARKFIKSSSNAITNDYLSVAKSNDLQSPNDHILFDKIKDFVIFRNISNDNIIKKSIKSFKFLKDIYKFYKDMYDDEILKNPSSQFKIEK